jgi:phosphoserine phosphatase RsbU/P
MMITETKEPVLLIADDQPDNLRAMIDILQASEHNFHFITVPNGRILIDIALKKQPDLIITDWEMPELTGLEAIKALKLHPETSDIPIIMCTGIMITPQDLKIAMEAGAVDFVRKPIDAMELIARVQSMLALSASYLTIKEQKEKLEQTNEVIRKQRDNIVSSINYARRIQAAILPSVEVIQSYLPESFVFYRPKDIVSGDFFWFQVLPDMSKIIIAADCTGHGVPGAFMTLIGNTLLNQIINENHITEPSEILSELDSRLVATLRQSDRDDSISDGMDISLLKISQDFVIWAASRRPLIYFQYNELKEIFGSKSPIGSVFSRKKVFEQHKIPIHRGDTFYLYSDGYVDQFNPNREKFTSKRLKELLSKIQHLEIGLQYNIIQETLDNWQGKERQIDDVLLVGVRI